jgi:FkbM family methyltransferase
MKRFFDNKYPRFFLSKVRFFLKRIGIDVIPRRYAHNLQELIWFFEVSGIDLHVVYDIGSNEGRWSRRVDESLKKNADFYLFEPNVVFNDRYKKLGFLNYYNVLLSDSKKEVDFFGIGSTGDSYFKEVNNRVFEGIKPKKITTVALDEIRNSLKLPQPDFIKIDTQGSELDILNGATGTLKNTKLVLIECPILEYNEGAPVFQAYLTKMAELSFLPIDLTEVHIVGNKLVQVDIAFVHENYFQMLKNR